MVSTVLGVCWGGPGGRLVPKPPLALGMQGIKQNVFDLLHEGVSRTRVARRPLRSP